MKRKMTDARMGEVWKEFDGSLTQSEEETIVSRCNDYVFYRPDGNRRECRCSACGGTWRSPKRNFKHKDRVACPKCGRGVTLLAAGRLRAWGNIPCLSERHTLAVLRVASDGGLLIQAGRLYIDWHMECDTYQWIDDVYTEWPVRTMTFAETRRYYIAPGERCEWKVTWGGRGWVPMASVSEPVAKPSYMAQTPDDGKYMVVGADTIRDSKLRYCGLDDYLRRTTGRYLLDGDFVRGLVSYLGEYATKPQLEMVAKLGYVDVIEDLVRDHNANSRILNWRAKTPHQFFKMSKWDFKKIHDAEVDWHTIKAWRTETSGSIPIEECIRMEQELGKNGFRTVGRCLRLAKRCGVSPEKAVEYIKKQGGTTAVTTWEDYLDMAQRLDFDMERADVLMPKDLHRRHDSAARIIYAEDHPKEMRKYRDRLKKLKRKFDFTSCGLQIVVPRDALEIVSEGKVLQHCVGGYADRHIKGAVVILFLRKVEEPHKPYVTIEMCGRDWSEIKQIHGHRNERDGKPSPRLVHKEFIDEWLSWLRAGSPRDMAGKPATEKEVKVG